MSLLSTVKSHISVTKEKIGIPVSYEKDGTPVIHGHKTSNQIQTLEQLLESSNVDTKLWEVDRWKPNVWNCYSNDNGIVPLWQVSAFLKKREFGPEQIKDFVKSALAGFKRGLTAKLPKFKHTPSGKMVLLGVPDLHLGKLAWGEETGHGHWDCVIAKEVWEKAIDDLISRAPDADECWFPIGNDFFNVDDSKNQTTAGTPQDEDGRWQKTFRLGVEITKWAIARCRKKYPKVKIIMVYGNHDRQRAWYLGELLSELSHFMDGVEVDNRPLDRKYFQWGCTGIGFAHGDRLKEKDIANLCQNEARDIWGRTTEFEMILGHFHGATTKPMGGVVARWFSALCAPDYWHAKSGYVMAKRMATLLVYDLEDGAIDQKFHNPKIQKYF